MQAQAHRDQIIDFHRSTLLRSNRSAGAPVLLSPEFVQRMLDKRRLHQVIKFRTTCSDCVPNL